MGSLIGQILMRTFCDEGSAGFYYENPANDLSDGENFVQERESDDDDILIGDGENGNGENDDSRGHDDDDHDSHAGFFCLRVDEGNDDIQDQDDESHESHGCICHFGSCSRSDESHGHNDDDHDLAMSDDDGWNNRDEGVERVEIYHGNCKGRA